VQASENMSDRAKHSNPDGRADPFRYVVKIDRIAAVAGLCFFSLAVWLVWVLFRGTVPDFLMRRWVVASALFLLSWLLIDIALLIRRPDDPALVKTWEWLANYVRLGSNLIVLATVWLFFPFAARPLQLVMTAFYVAHVPTQILTVPARGRINAAGAFVVLGSVAIVNLMDGGDYAQLVAIFVAAFAIVMVNLALVLGRLISKVVEERRQSDEVAENLQIALIEVAASRDAKTQFIAAASHDLGQPLQAASLFFDQTLRAPDAALRNQAADGVRKAFASADLLLSHMLNHLRLEADAVDPHYSRLAVGQVIARVAAQFGPAAATARIKITVVRSSARLRIDRVLLERALGNLINNAVHHSGGTRLLIGARRGPPGTLRIWVIDNGVGIARIDGERIFEDYYRGSDSRAAVKSGFGLGLSSVRRIATLMHGEAGLDPRWLNGSAFYLDFPTQIPAKEALS
jgi:signal transduction histidine kinase